MTDPWRPQLRLVHLLWITTFCAGIFALVMADDKERFVAAYILSALGGSLAVTGIIYGRGVRRAFFIGAAVPLASVLYLLVFTRRIDHDIVLLILLLSLVCGAASAALAWWLTQNSSGER